MDIGQLLSTFGTAGFFIWYLLNREKVSTEKIINKLDKLASSIDDYSLLLFDLLDEAIPKYAVRRNSKAIKQRISDRQKDNAP